MTLSLTQTAAYAAKSATTPLEPFHFNARQPNPDDVVIDILYCGVCHSDLHQARNDWGNSKYPMVPGHEIVGRVSSIGDAVTKFKPGQMIAVGTLVDSCGECASCDAGLEVYCENRATGTYNDVNRHDGLPTFGGYSKQITTREKFVLSLPEKLDPKSAAPLLCAGITVYSPLRHWKAGPGMSIAVIGLGGLGHMALKFAHSLGAEVTLFSRTADKEHEARRLGADDFVISTDPEQMKAVSNKFNLIIDTVPNAHDLNPYMATLKLNGTLVIVGQITEIEPPISGFTVIAGRKSIAGSGTGGIPETQEMLDYCAEHNVSADVEIINIQDIEESFVRMQNSDVRYRFVIDLASLEG